MNGIQRRLLQTLRSLLFLAPLLYVHPLIAENLLYEFGPKTDKAIVFTAATSGDNQSTTATVQLQDFAKKLSAQPPDIHIVVAVTKNDISELPPDIPVKRYEGIKSLIQTLTAYPNAAVCLIDSGDNDTARIITGTSQGTSPAWLLKRAYDELQQNNIAIDFYTDAVVFHRLGWIPDDPALRLYNEAALPVIKIETNANLSGFFSSFAEAAVQDIGAEWDTHYFVKKINGKLIITTERHIVIILIASSMIFLLWLMFFSFLFGKKREQHIKDLLFLWWMPIYFFAVNWFGFLLGSHIAEFFFYLRFSSVAEMNAFPLTAFLVKYVFALFFMVTFTAYNKFIPLPANRFIYGFMAHAVCLFNVFIFSYTNLSFSIVFLLIYFISLIAYHFKNIVLQIIFIICLFLPIMPLIIHIIRYRQYMFDTVFFINAYPAYIFVPFALFLIRLSLSLDKKKKTARSIKKIPIQCKLVGALFLTFILWVCVMPVKKNVIRNHFTLVHYLTENKSIVIKKYVNPPEEEITVNYERSSNSSAPENAADFLTVHTSLENYFERSIGSITVDSPLRIEAVSITVSAQNGTAIFESDAAFEQNASGDVATFVSSPRPTIPFAVHFSGKKDTELIVTVVLWSKENPFGIRLIADAENESGKRGGSAHRSGEQPFLLKVEKTLHIAADSVDAV